MNKSSRLTAVFLILLAGAAQAAGPDVMTAEIVAQQKAIRAEMDARSGRFADMPAVKRRQVEVDQERLLRLIEGKESVRAMTPATRVEVSNAIDSINAAIADTDDERMVCERVKKVGSNFVTRECKTVAQRTREREDAQTRMRDDRAHR